MFDEPINEGTADPRYSCNGIIQFVGRNREIDEIKTTFRKRKARLQHIYGFPLMGKERLAKQVEKEFIQESRDKNVNLTSIHVSCSMVKTWTTFLDKVISICLNENVGNLDVEHLRRDGLDTEESLISLLSRTFGAENKYLLLVFTKCDDPTVDDCNQTKLVTFCDRMLNLSNNIFILITSQVKLQFVPNNIVRFAKLTALWPAEAKSLLLLAVKDTEFDSLEEDIVKGCCYIPGLVLDAARILQHPDGLIDARALCALLSSPETALKTFSMKHVNPCFQLTAIIKRLFNRLLDYQMQKDILGLSLFRGEFSIQAAAAVLGYKDENEAAISSLIPLSDQSVLDVVQERQKFKLNPFLRIFLMQSSFPVSIYERNPQKLRFIKFFGEVLQTVDAKLFAKPERTVIGYLQEDIDNVKEMMSAAINSNEDVYNSIMTAVRSSEEIFIHCFEVEQVRDFYEHLLQTAEKTGTVEDVAILKCLLGQILASKKVDGNSTTILKLYKEAMVTLKDSNSKYHLFMLLGLTAHALNRQGNYKKGRRYLRKALDMEVEDCDRRKVERRKISVFSQEAIAELFLERRSSAIQIINDALKHARNVAPFHPDIPVLLNSLGLIHEKNGENDRALHYYKVSLQARRPFAETKPEILVPTLINIGNQLFLGGSYDLALERYDEALQIRRRLGWKDYFTGLTLFSIGKVYLLMLQFCTALQNFEEAKEIFKICTPNHFILNEVNIAIAHYYQITGNTYMAREIYNSVLDSEQTYVQKMPRGDQMSNVYYHLLNLAEKESWHTTYEKLQKELHRLGACAKEDGDQVNFIAIQRRILKLRTLFTCWLERDISEVHRSGVEIASEKCIYCRQLKTFTATKEWSLEKCMVELGEEHSENNTFTEEST